MEPLLCCIVGQSLLLPIGGLFAARTPIKPAGRVRHATAALLLAVLLWPTVPQAQQRDDVSMVFQQRVDAYIARRQRAREGLAPEQIVDPRIRTMSTALFAARLRQLRADAIEGDVFSAPMSAFIRQQLHRAFKPTDVDMMLDEVYPDGPPRAATIQINLGCAGALAIQPPAAVLAALPPVPSVLGYRLVGVDVVLWDEEAGIVVDIVRHALPEPRVWDFVDIGSFEMRRRIRESLRLMGIDAAELVEEMAYEAPAGWRAIVGEPFCWAASGVMPPTVLYVLPELPLPLEYRFVASDLVVVDVRSAIVMGVLRDALPRPAFDTRT